MSKRFGRNQKRKLKQQIADQEKELKNKENSITRYVNELAHYYDMVKLIEHMCKHSILLEPKNIDGGNLNYPYQIAMWGFNNIAYSMDVHFPEFKRVDLHALEISIENSPNFSKYVHLMQKSGTPGHSVYRISDNILNDIPVDYIQKYLAPELCRQLIEVIQNERLQKYK